MIIPVKQATFTFITNSNQIQKLKDYKHMIDYKFKTTTDKLIQQQKNDITKEVELDEDYTDEQIQQLNDNLDFIKKEFKDLLSGDDDLGDQAHLKALMYYGMYLSFDSFKVGVPAKMNLSKTKLRAEICDTLYNKATDYKGKTLTKLIKNNEFKDDHRTNACVYTTLLKMYKETVKIEGNHITYNNLYKFFHGKKFVEGDDLGLSVEQLKTFFEKNQ